MRIAHIALWTNDLERLKEFYDTYFGGTSGKKYVNEAKGFESYFIRFQGEATLEIMRRKDITQSQSGENLGLCHLAFEVSDRAEVRSLTERLRLDGVPVLGEPRLTGDGCFESVVADPDGNRIEIVAP